MHNTENSDNKTLHDFQDGNGPVPAHRHLFGGGWVADLAHVDDAAYIGKNACVFGNAVVKDELLITDHAQVSGFSHQRSRSACAAIPPFPALAWYRMSPNFRKFFY